MGLVGLGLGRLRCWYDSIYRKRIKNVSFFYTFLVMINAMTGYFPSFYVNFMVTLVTPSRIQLFNAVTKFILGLNQLMMKFTEMQHMNFQGYLIIIIRLNDQIIENNVLYANNLYKRLRFLQSITCHVN